MSKERKERSDADLARQLLEGDGAEKAEAKRELELRLMTLNHYASALAGMVRAAALSGAGRRAAEDAFPYKVSLHIGHNAPGSEGARNWEPLTAGIEAQFRSNGFEPQRATWTGYYFDHESDTDDMPYTGIIVALPRQAGRKKGSRSSQRGRK